MKTTLQVIAGIAAGLTILFVLICIYFAATPLTPKEIRKYRDEQAQATLKEYRKQQDAMFDAQAEFARQSLRAQGLKAPD